MIEKLVAEAYKSAEVGFLGSVINDADFCIEEAMLEITADDFLHSEFKNIWNIILELYEESRHVDIYTVKARAGAAYQKLVDDISILVPTAANWDIYAKELKRQAKLYKASEIASRILDASASPGTEISDMRTDAEELVKVLENSSAIKTEFTMKEMVKNFLDDMDKPKEYLNWGLSKLTENILCEPGDYVMIGATPSTGKTALALQIGVNMARSGKRVMFFSYETTAKRLMDRIMACQGRIPLPKIKAGVNSQNQNEYAETARQYNQAGRQLYNLPFMVVESAGMTVDDIRAKAIKNRADVIFIDYIQQVSHKNEKLNEYQRITEVSRGIQALCQKYKITTIALSQFSRLHEGKKPTLSSFRSSGQLEQDINFGILFYRPEELKDDEEDNRRVFEIAKSKDGRIGKIKMWFDGEYQTFTVEEPRY